MGSGDTSKQQGQNKQQGIQGQQGMQGHQGMQGQQGDGANGVIQQAKETLNQGVERVSKSTGQVYDSAIQYSKKNPGAAIGIALASGATLGFLLGRTSKSRYDDSLWGAVTSAALRAAIDRWS